MTVIAIVLVLPLPSARRRLRGGPPTVTRYDQTDEHIDYAGTWDTFEKTAAYKTAYTRANTRGASVTIYFSGTRLDWIAMKGTSTGKADVYLDDVFQKTVDLAAASAVYQVAVWSTGDLPSGRHKVTISRSASTPAGTFVTLDAVDVAGTLVYGPPAVTGLSPVSGSTAGGASVAITGTDFTDASAVTFGDADATSFTVESSTLITAVAPPHDAGTVSVKVTTPSGSSTDTSADDYQYAQVTVPTITGVSPASGASGDFGRHHRDRLHRTGRAGRGHLRRYRRSQVRGRLANPDHGRRSVARRGQGPGEGESGRRHDCRHAGR